MTTSTNSSLSFPCVGINVSIIYTPMKLKTESLTATTSSATTTTDPTTDTHRTHQWIRKWVSVSLAVKVRKVLHLTGGVG